MRTSKKSKKAAGFGGIFVSAILFCVMMVVLAGTMNSLGGTASEEGVATTKAAIQRTAVVCYATEGFYPPSLAYMEERYGLMLDRDRYSISYEVFAQNVAPNIIVRARTPREAA